MKQPTPRKGTEIVEKLCDLRSILRKQPTPRKGTEINHEPVHAEQCKKNVKKRRHIREF